jgi:hypothetical protein
VEPALEFLSVINGAFTFGDGAVDFRGVLQVSLKQSISVAGASRPAGSGGCNQLPLRSLLPRDW